MMLMSDSIIVTQMETSPTINSIESFYLGINQRYKWESIHIAYFINQYFLGIVLLTYNVGGIVNGNET